MGLIQKNKEMIVRYSVMDKDLFTGNTVVYDASSQPFCLRYADGICYVMDK